MTNSTITREQLIENLKHRIAVTEKYPHLEEAQIDSQIFKIALVAMDSEPAPVVPDDVLDALRKVARIRLDLNDFDGDRRGIADCLGDAEEALIEVVNRRAAMVQAGNSPVIPDSARDALLKALAAMEFMGDTLNNLDAVCTEDVELVAPAFDAVRSVLAAAPQEVR